MASRPHINRAQFLDGRPNFNLALQFSVLCMTWAVLFSLSFFINLFF